MNSAISLRGLAVGGVMAFLCVYASAEPPPSLGKARQVIQTGISRESPEQLLALFRQLPVRPGAPHWEEGAYLGAELALKADALDDKNLARPLLETLSKEADSSWKVRGDIGLIRVSAAGNPADLAARAKELDLMLTRLSAGRDEATVDAAFWLGMVYRQLGQDAESRRSFEYAIEMLRSLRRYDATAGYQGILTEQAIREAIAPREPPKPAPEPQATFAKAQALQRAKKYQEAIVLYQTVVDEWSRDALADQAGFRIGECFFQGGQIALAKTSLEAFAAAAPRGAWRGHALVVLGDIALLHQFDPNAAFPLYARAVGAPLQAEGSRKTRLPPRITEEMLARVPFENKSPDDTWHAVAADAHRQIGIIAYFLGHREVAAKHLKRSATLRPDSTFGKEGGLTVLAEIAESKEELLPAWYLEEGDDRTRFVLFVARALASGWEGDEAIALFERVCRNEFGGATPEQRAYARFGIGESHFLESIKRRPQAMEVYREFLKPPLSASKIAPRALLSLAVSHSANAETDKAIVYLDMILREYPDSPYRVEGLFNRAFVSYCKDPATVALAWHDQFLREFPRHDWAKCTRWFKEQIETEIKTGKKRP